MADVLSSWLVGSVELGSAATVTINGSDHDVAAGSYYAWDASAARSAVDALEAAIQLEVATASVFVRKDRRVEIDFDGNATTITIPAALRTPLGFTTGTYGPATSVTADTVPALIWASGWPTQTDGSPVGVLGRKVWDRVATASPTGENVTVTVHHSTRLLDVSWRAVRSSRAWTSAEAPGEFVDFFERIIVPGLAMKLYSGITEDDDSADPVAWPDELGPYWVPDPPWDWYQRFVSVSDSLGANIGPLTLQLTEDL